MRPIKFRVWDNNSKEYVNPDFIKVLGNGHWTVWDEINDIEARNGDECGSQLVLEQYTGLKDKNGKEIYEGDTVNVHVFVRELGENMGVTEGEREFVANIEFGSAGVNLVMGENDSGPIWAYDGIHEESFEIIGSIHDEEKK